jgi:hypothetical protein
MKHGLASNYPLMDLIDVVYKLGWVGSNRGSEWIARLLTKACEFVCFPLTDLNSACHDEWQ